MKATPPIPTARPLPTRPTGPTGPTGQTGPTGLARPTGRRVTRARGHVAVLALDGEQSIGGGQRAGKGQSAAGSLRITFFPSQTVTEATPGLMLAQVAEDAGVPVNVGCGEGQCGACEMEIKKEGGAGDAFVVRSCVTPVPRAELIAQGGEHWEVSTEFDFGSAW